MLIKEFLGVTTAQPIAIYELGKQLATGYAYEIEKAHPELLESEVGTIVIDQFGNGAGVTFAIQIKHE